MLKFYSIPYLKRNRATTAFLAVSSFLTALLLSVTAVKPENNGTENDHDQNNYFFVHTK